MKAITHFEVYIVKHGRWSLHSRLGAGERDVALDLGRRLETEMGPAQVLEERFDPESGETDIKILQRPGQPSPDVQAPAADSNLTSRLLMVGVNAFGIGAILTVLMATVLSASRNSGIDAPASVYNMILLFTFAAAALAAGLVLFRIYIPGEFILWRGKSTESQRRTIQTLLHGAQNEPPPTRAVRAPRVAPPLPPRENMPITNADGDQTTFSFSTSAQPDATAAPTAQEMAATTAADLMNNLLEQQRKDLLAFTDSALSLLAAAKPQLSAFERYGLNLYLAGAVNKVAERSGLDNDIKLVLMRQILQFAGNGKSTAQSFCERLDSAATRPQFALLIEAGSIAMASQLDLPAESAHANLVNLIQQWADPNARGAQAEIASFLLTDLVGSTALTSKIGNSGAQRVVRAHNTIVRGAAHNYKGKEIKHTGDGMLVAFTDAAAAARAAMEIQQDAFAYARDNVDAPLSLRVGLHAGDVSMEEGEYFGEAVLLLDGICAVAEAGQISCTEDIKSKCVGGVFRFADLGMRTVKGSETQHQIFLLEWLPKPDAAKGPIEYRHIGTRPQAVS